MVMLQESTVRKEWSSVCDSIICEKPAFIERTRGKMWISNLDIMLEILKAYQFTAKKYMEKDGSVTLSLNEIDLIENGEDEQKARLLLGKSILAYSIDYYNEYELYSRSPNRKQHIPYVFKALIMEDSEKIGESILCQNGKN